MDCLHPRPPQNCLKSCTLDFGSRAVGSKRTCCTMFPERSTLDCIDPVADLSPGACRLDRMFEPWNEIVVENERLLIVAKFEQVSACNCFSLQISWFGDFQVIFDLLRKFIEPVIDGF
ncbi:hypothetical protein QQ045_006448 [Rhodiola kirilowii]